MAPDSATNRGATPPAIGPEDSRSSSSTNSPIPADNEESDFFHGGNDSQSSVGIPNTEDMQVSDVTDDSEDYLPGVAKLPNEILISIFARLNSTSDLFRCMLVSKRWAKNAVDLLWHRPACNNWQNYSSVCRTLQLETPFFAYRGFIKRLNLAASGLADKISDGSVIPLAVCTRVERLTLTNCRQLTDQGLVPLVTDSSFLLALDVSGNEHITDASIRAVAKYCKKLQGLNISGCRQVTNEGMILLAQNCRYLKRLKLNECAQLQDVAVFAFAEHCPNILEIDLQQCIQIQNEPITALLTKGQSLRELRLAGCELIDDSAFLSLPPNRTFSHLRILDLTSCARVTDATVIKIIDAAPRLRNLVLAKCRNITDAAVYAISKLGKNLHYLHLGHCSQITDDAVKRLVQQCNRMRYIDLGCCTLLTDDSVMRLAQLPKLKRIGLVKCSNITDESILALARANHRPRARRDAFGNIIGEEYHSSLERVHLSYCTNLTLKSIIKLLKYCPRLTHLSLTGVAAFLREEFAEFCRPPPPEFTEHQRGVFCVFSGAGVSRLREYLHTAPEYEALRDWAHAPRFAVRTAHDIARLQSPNPQPRAAGPAVGDDGAGYTATDAPGPEGAQEAQAVQGLHGSEMALDAQQPTMQAHHLVNGNAFAGVPPVPPIHHGPAGGVTVMNGTSPQPSSGTPPTVHFQHLTHPQTHPASQARQPPMIVSEFYHQADASRGSSSPATAVSPHGVNMGAAGPSGSGQSSLGASTASMQGQNPPDGAVETSGTPP
ncbi:hypothetical protein ACRALDRAFT_1063101 [Sodiomyces alcalophilus JCM 7366]|uniref:uncharacterized protein n=1 Tax=Sodiomyces alcalophilus JCM 7366 TaxID=591952 RepID=UPI0039B37DDE